MTPAEAAAAANLGTPSARKSGRSPERPYVPIILHGVAGRTRTEQILVRAFATRAEAVACAEAAIAARRATLEQQLGERRYRALREAHGLPRELEL